MIVRKATEEQIREAGKAVGVRIHDLRKSGSGFRFTLSLDKAKRYQRISHQGRKVNAVCFHGHWAFFRTVFALAPEATIITSHARFESAEDLEDKALSVGNQNIGSMFQPMAYEDACICHQRGSMYPLGER